MRKPKKKVIYHASFLYERYYHVYNRTNNKEPLFKSDKDRIYFLKKLKSFLLPYLKIYAFCLLKNHFHLLIKVKEKEVVLKHLEKIPRFERTKVQNEFMDTDEDFRKIHTLVSLQFLRFFTTYSMFFNKKYNRQGNLFTRRFRRVLVKKDSHFRALIFYIHANPSLHGFFEDFRKYKWSSYLANLSVLKTDLCRGEILEWFGGREEYILFHRRRLGMDEFENLEELVVE